MKKRFNRTDKMTAWLIQERLQWIQRAIDTGHPYKIQYPIEEDVESVRRFSEEIDTYLGVLYMAGTITLDEYNRMYEQMSGMKSTAVWTIRSRVTTVTVRVPA